MKEIWNDKAHEECGVFGVYRKGDELDVVSTTSVSYTHLDVYKRQVFSLYDECGALSFSQTGSVRVRGNSTAQYPKLPYRCV